MLLKRLTLYLTAALLTFVLVGLILSVSIWQVFGSPQTVRQLLKESGIYGALIPEQLIKTGQTNPSFAGVPLEDPDIQRVIAGSFEPEEVEKSGDQVASGLLAWLEGETASPEFETTIGLDRERLATSLGELTEKRVSELPACTSNQEVLQSVEQPFQAECAPVWLQPAAAGDFVENQVRSNAASIPDIALTDESVRLAGDTTISEQLSGAPEWYQRLQYLPAALAVLAVALAGLLLLLGKLRRGLTALGLALTAGGLISLAIGLMIGPKDLARLGPLDVQTASAALRQAIDRLAGQALAMIEGGIWLYGSGVLGAGVLMLVVQRFLRRRGTS